MRSYEAALHEFLQANVPAILEEIEQKGMLSDDSDRQLNETIRKFTKDFLDKK